MSKTTLDQWRVFNVVARENGFSAAAEKLHRSQSTVSYTIQKLQSQLGVKLYEEGRKKWTLTKLGQELLEEARPVLESFDRLENKALNMRNGVESHIQLLVENIFPKDILFEAISRLSILYPDTHVQVVDQVRLIPAENIDFDLAIGVSHKGLVPGPKLLEVELILVAHFAHPLFLSHESPFHRLELMKYNQIMYQHRDDIGGIRNHGENRFWSVNSVETALAAIKAKQCWGLIPRHSVTAMLASGELKEIKLKDEHMTAIPLYLAQPEQRIVGPATKYLSNALLDVCREVGTLK